MCVVIPLTSKGVHTCLISNTYCLDRISCTKICERHSINSFSVNFHLVQSQLRIDVSPIIAYAGYTHLLARATIAQWFQYKFKLI